MRKLTILIVLFVLVITGCEKKQPEITTPVIVTSISIYQDFVKQIVRDACIVHSLVEGMENPHTLDLSGKDIQSVQNASLIVFNGMGLEGWADQLIGNIDPDQTKYLMVGDSLQGNELLVHGDNPHVWMDPRITQAIIHLILPDLQKILPDSAQVFQERADSYIQGLNDLYRDIGLKLEPMEGKRIIAQTPGLDYFFSAFNVTRSDVIIEHPGGEPSARHMTELSNLLKAGDITGIVQLPQFSESLPNTLSQESDIPITTMSPLINGVEYVETYLDLMWYNADQLSLLAPPEA